MITELILDVDGVLLDYDSSFERMVTERFGIDFDGSCIDFCESKYFSELGSHLQSDVYIKKLHKLGMKLRIITACGDTDKIKKMRLINLYNVFGDVFESIDFVGMGESKQDYLEKFAGRDDVAYIEDTIERFLLAKSMGIKSYLMLSFSTREMTGGIFDDWKQLFHFLTKSI